MFWSSVRCETRSLFDSPTLRVEDGQLVLGEDEEGESREWVQNPVTRLSSFKQHFSSMGGICVQAEGMGQVLLRCELTGDWSDKELTPSAVLGHCDAKLVVPSKGKIFYVLFSQPPAKETRGRHSSFYEAVAPVSELPSSPPPDNDFPLKPPPPKKWISWK